MFHPYFGITIETHLLIIQNLV